ncbi:hypothetical protein JTB14_014054 [Gonioctena quinquepunctata]|nr:hypothetical protein JTB14_014054 [Gonioctena quinquepunctata]
MTGLSVSCFLVLVATLRVTNGISGGSEVKPHSSPYQVALSVFDVQIPDKLKKVCGGSLISENIVLTAANCLDDSSFIDVEGGVHNLREYEETNIQTAVLKKITHPKYNATTRENDIALLYVVHPFPQTNVSQIIKLTPASTGSLAGGKALLTGWGMTYEGEYYVPPMHGAVLKIMDNKACGRLVDDIGGTNLCTSGKDGVGACSEDEGSPLVKKGVQIALVSSVPKACGDGNPTVYTRISNYRDWIYEISGI